MNNSADEKIKMLEKTVAIQIGQINRLQQCLNQLIVSSDNISNKFHENKCMFCEKDEELKKNT